MSQKKFAVLGAGAWGTALALSLARNGNLVAIWSKDTDQCQQMQLTRANHQYLPDIRFPENVQVENDLIKAMNFADYVLVAVPSHAFKAVVTEIQPYMAEKSGLIWATKGFDPASGEFLSNCINELLGNEFAKALMTGPSFAVEVAANLPTIVAIVSNNENFAKEIHACFHSETFRCYLDNDLIGAQLGGAVKNVLSVAVGVAEGIGYGMNAKAGLMTRGLAEMIRLGEVLGAKTETLIGLSGLGDLILTCSDNKSRNRRFGLAIGQGKDMQQACEEIGQVVEAIYTTKTIYDLAKENNIYMPITTEVYRLLYENISPKQAVKNLTR